jgi:hypothetical protein
MEYGVKYTILPNSPPGSHNVYNILNNILHMGAYSMELGGHNIKLKLD